MPDRTTETTVTFRRPFTLSALDGVAPAGAYRVAIDEDEILGLSFLAYRRTATTLHTPSIENTHGPRRTVTVDPAELDAALEADAKA